MKPEKQLYQWDTNQSLVELTQSAQFVDYPIGNEVIRIKSDGTRCRIPDEVLQTYGGKTCYERYPDGTYRAYSFSVLYAPKPPDYVYTPEERTTFEALTARVDATIDEIKRRADSGEFDGKTPVKGVDYYTKEEQAELITAVSSGAESEFRKVTEEETAKFEATAESKLTDYNRNAAEKLTTYDTNDEQRTSDYNSNAERKLEAYNQNHTEKVAEYNKNAEIKKAEFDANVGEQIAEKANIDGYYEEMTVGDAEQLVATQFVEDNKPYLFRPTGGSSDVGNRAYFDKIVGGTVAWNQQVDTSTALLTTRAGVTLSRKENGKLFLSGTATGGTAWCIVGSANLVVGHKYISARMGENVPLRVDNAETGNPAMLYEGDLEVKILTGEVKSYVYAPIIEGVTVNTEIDPFIIDLTQMFGSTIADYIYSFEQSQAGAGVAWFKKLFPKDYYPYNAGELLSVEGLQSHDTVGFNQWDEEWEIGSYGSDGLPIVSNDKIRTKNRISVKPSTAYYFKISGSGNFIIFWYDDNDTVISYETTNNAVKTSPANAKYLRFITNNYGTTYNHDICINLSDPSRNGEYEPYKKHSYPLDSSLTLRGIPKLGASNNLYYNGDEYTSDGNVKRKYGVVDLGNLNWGYQAIGTSTVAPYMYADVRSLGIKRIGYFGTMVHNIICPKYTTVARNPTAFVDKTICTDGDAKTVLQIQIKDSAYTDATAFKTAMSGVYLVYELATPTTEEADPFQHIQIVDDFGTEEFVSTGIVPVGHNTRYPANLRDKLQHLPSLASADGTYLIQQSGKQMSLIHMPAVFPEIQTEDGTYTLKTVVTGGVATLQWVAE